MTNRKHTVKGTLIKFNTVTCGGWMVTPEAFKDCDGTYIPVYKDTIYKKIPEAIGFARLRVTDDGVDYTAVLWDNEDAPDIFDQITLHNNKLCLYANQIEKTDNVVTHGKICGSILDCVDDQASCVREIDGVELSKIREEHNK